MDLGAEHLRTMSPAERHRRGAHYTPEDAIVAHVIRPSLVAPFEAAIEDAGSSADLERIREELLRVVVLDPACGSGNFLIAALKALRALHDRVLHRLGRPAAGLPSIRTSQLAGIDTDDKALAIARRTLLRERSSRDDQGPALLCADALFCDWPKADVIVTNPPFQSKNKLQTELPLSEIRRLRARYPGVPGRADYCVYWIQRAHDELPPGGRAGIVGTNTIAQTWSREGGLDYVVKNGGTLIEAVTSMTWPGEAGVDVAIVNWVKGPFQGPKRLSRQEDDRRGGALRTAIVSHIPSSLSEGADVTSATSLRANARSGACYQGQTHGHEGFLLSFEEASAMALRDPTSRAVLAPYLTGDDLLSHPRGEPSRWVIDLRAKDVCDAERHAAAFAHVTARVLPARREAAIRERARNHGLAGERGNQHHNAFLKRYWQLSYPREELMHKLAQIPRYIACSRVTKRPIFAFVASSIHPSDALTVFPLADDYSFGVLQSDMHWAWLKARCSTLTSTFRYTSETVFDSFPWPETPSPGEVRAVAEAAVALRRARREAQAREGIGLRALHAMAEGDAKHPLWIAHEALNQAVREAYGRSRSEDALTFLLGLNHTLAAREQRGEAVRGPGLPYDGMSLVSDDAVSARELARLLRREPAYT